jgi:hypothetical protein
MYSLITKFLILTMHCYYGITHYNTLGMDTTLPWENCPTVLSAMNRAVTWILNTNFFTSIKAITDPEVIHKQ